MENPEAATVIATADGKVCVLAGMAGNGNSLPLTWLPRRFDSVSRGLPLISSMAISELPVGGVKFSKLLKSTSEALKMLGVRRV